MSADVQNDRATEPSTPSDPMPTSTLLSHLRGVVPKLGVTEGAGRAPRDAGRHDPEKPRERRA